MLIRRREINRTKDWELKRIILEGESTFVTNPSIERRNQSPIQQEAE
jgi:hypothetical protein